MSMTRMSKRKQLDKRSRKKSMPPMLFQLKKTKIQPKIKSKTQNIATKNQKTKTKQRNKS